MTSEVESARVSSVAVRVCGWTARGETAAQAVLEEIATYAATAFEMGLPTASIEDDLIDGYGRHGFDDVMIDIISACETATPDCADAGCGRPVSLAVYLGVP